MEPAVGPTRRNVKRSLSSCGITSALIAGMLFSLFTLAASAQQSPASEPSAQAQPAPPPPPAPPSADQGQQTVHIVVGHSLLIHTPSRVKRILTGNPAVIESVVTSPEELVITAKEPGSSSLMLWDETGKSRSLDVDADMDITGLRNSLDQSFPHSNVDVQAEGTKIIMVGMVAY